MQKLSLIQSLQQKLSPQQIQFIKLLQVPTAELETRIEEELEVNPALEEGKEEKEAEEQAEDHEEDSETSISENIEDYLPDDYTGYKMQGDGRNPDEEGERPLSVGKTLHEHLISQLGYIKLDDREQILGKQLIGSIDPDGYIRRELEAIVNDLAFSQGVETDEEELENILFKIQNFDPAGVGSRNLQECLSLQLERRDDEEKTVQLAKKIIDTCFNEFSKKHYDKIAQKLDVRNEEELREAIYLITKLNPKPGGTGDEVLKTVQYVIPDFTLANNNDGLELLLNSANAPQLKINQAYADMLDAYDKSDKKDKKLKETASFIRQKLDAAKWFIDAIHQRQQTLLNTMQAIIDLQYDYFLEGDESKLKPMILKDVAEKIDMDISTVSRVASSKHIQTAFGVFPLKYFFSEGISTDFGEEVSSREVKNKLKGLIAHEDKSRPLSDEKIEKALKESGYNIARRTVAKYREQLGIPVARLRRQL